MASRKTRIQHKERKERKSRRNLRKTRRGGMYSENETNAAEILLNLGTNSNVKNTAEILLNLGANSNKKNAAQGLLKLSSSRPYVFQRSIISEHTKLAYIRDNEKKISILLEPYTIQAKKAGKLRNVMIEEYKQLLKHYQAQFLRDLGIERVSRLEDIYPMIEKIYNVLFDMLNRRNPKKELKQIDPMYLVKIVVYAQEIVKYSEQHV